MSSLSVLLQQLAVKDISSGSSLNHCHHFICCGSFKHLKFLHQRTGRICSSEKVNPALNQMVSVNRAAGFFFFCCCCCCCCCFDLLSQTQTAVSRALFFSFFSFWLKSVRLKVPGQLFTLDVILCRLLFTCADAFNRSSCVTCAKVMNTSCIRLPQQLLFSTNSFSSISQHMFDQPPEDGCIRSVQHGCYSYCGVQIMFSSLRAGIK